MLSLLGQPGTAVTAQVPVLSAHSDLVVLRVTVKDKKGALVEGLDRQAFDVLEDGVPQQIQMFNHEDIPVTVGLVVDDSGSMLEKRDRVVTALLAFARLSNPDDEIFTVQFNEHVTLGLETPFTNQPGPLRSALASLSALGRTALYDAIDDALRHIAKGTKDRRVLIVISDGADNASQRATLEGVIRLAQQASVTVHTIGVFAPDDRDRNPKVLKRIARDTGGEAMFPRAVNDVVKTCERIASEIRNSYTLAYDPTNTRRDGGYRRVDVRIVAPRRRDLTARTRPGYFAPAGTSQP